MNAIDASVFRNQLFERRQKLEAAISALGEARDLVRLLGEVDAALERMAANIYGECQACHEAIGADFLQANPLIQYCLCNLTPEQQEELQRDLELATRIQLSLLPPQDLCAAGWETHFRYLPAGAVSGDYCDLMRRDGRAAGGQNQDGSLYFLVGDVAGKGVAAAFLMARLNAMFRSLIELELPLHELVARANRLFGDGLPEWRYATLVAGRADHGGEIEICNAGHCPPLLARNGEVVTVDSTGFPVGLFRTGPYTSLRLELAPGDTLLLHTDGLVESTNQRGEEYGIERAQALLRANHKLEARTLAARCLQDLNEFLAGAPPSDDLTLLVLRRAA